MENATQPVGDLLRKWRVRRRMTQMDLALEADVSTRHVSFIETGRSLPSRDMIERLADRLDIPLRQRNTLHVAAGLAPAYPERSLQDVDMDAARATIDIVLRGHEPFPSLAVDRHWNLVAANTAASGFLDGVDPDLLAPPVNVIRLTLHPAGLAPRIANFPEWRAHMLGRIDRQIDRTFDPELMALRDEVGSWPSSGITSPPSASAFGTLAVPLKVRTGAVVHSFLYTTTLFGAPLDLTLSEIAIETFFPADDATREAFHRVGAGRG